MNLSKYKLSSVKILLTFFAIATIILLLPNLNLSFGVEYTNYTSEKYHIQFQYPTNWNVTEKTDRFSENTDIAIRESGAGKAVINIIYMDDASSFGFLNIRTMTETGLEEVTRDDYSREYRVIERPSYLTIDGNEAGTFLYTVKNKLEETEPIAAQPWNVLANNHYYIISFSSTTSVFDSPDNTQIRDHFIKSIRFLN